MTEDHTPHSINAARESLGLPPFPFPEAWDITVPVPASEAAISAVHAPWKPDQVIRLNTYQRSVSRPFMHRTDDHRATLVAEPHGWVCPEPDCGFVQDWTPHWTLWSIATPGIPYPDDAPSPAGPVLTARPVARGSLFATLARKVRADHEREDYLAQRLAHAEGRIKGLIRHAQRQQETIRALEAHTDATCDAVAERDELRRALRDTVAMLRGQTGVAA